MAWKVYRIDQVSLKYRKPEHQPSLVGVRSESFRSADGNSDSFRVNGGGAGNSGSFRANRGGVVLEGLSEVDEDDTDSSPNRNEDDQASRRSLRDTFSKASSRMGSFRQSRKQFRKDNPRTVEVFSQVRANECHDSNV